MSRDGQRDAAPLSARRGRGALESPPRVSVPPARPFWFGDSERPLFGWYHAPAQPGARAAVVICNAFGHEAMVSHRLNRRLAQLLANEGFAVLRFDYDGTGDSGGTDQDPDRVEAWLSSIRRAIQEVGTLSGSSQVVLIGLRLGTLLAALQAERSMVDALVLIGPPRSGKAWLREMRALQAIKDAQNDATEGAPLGELGIGGFMLSEATRSDLAGLSFSQLERPPAKDALVIARDDLPSGEPGLVQYLLGLGVAAELSAAPGYAAAMAEDPFKSVLPLQMFDVIMKWLSLRFPGGAHADTGPQSTGAPVSGRPSVMTMALPTPTTREQVVDIDGLFGILTEPAVPSSQTRTAVVLLNIGANHHVGSNRMYVRMARAWAEQGFQVLRMDFSGMGDSPTTKGGKENEVYAARFMAEARAGVDFAQAQGATRFVLVGLCSGAYVAYHTAIADPRVSGVVMINPLTFHWTEGDSLEVRMRESFKSTTQYRRTLFRLDTWRRIVRGDVGVVAIAGELARRAQRRTARELKSIHAKLTGEIAEATDVERGFRQLCARGTQCFLVFGAEDGGIDVIEEHLGRAPMEMRSLNGFHLHIKEGPDHTFTPLWTQDWLLDFIGAHLAEYHGSDSR